MMRRLFVLAVLFGFVGLSSAAESLSAAQMERLILGAWSEKAELEGFTVSGTSRYSPDHTVEHIGSVVGADSKVNFRFRSTWRIEGNTLITEVLESDQPEMVAVGYVERDTILSMSEAQWTYRDSDGMEFTVVRFQQ